MNTPNLAALVFVLLGVGCILLGLVFTTFLLLHGPVPAMETLGRTAPGLGVPALPLLEEILERRAALFWALLAASYTLPATLFAASGALIWFLVGRPARRRRLQEAADEPHREDRLQALIRDRLERFGGDLELPSASSGGGWVLAPGALDPRRWGRLELFFQESGLRPAGFEVPAVAASKPVASYGERRVWARILTVMLLGVAVFGILLGAVGAFLFEELAVLAPFPTLPHEDTVLLLFCWAVALLALSAAAGVQALSALDRRDLRHRDEARSAARERLLAAHEGHLDRISGRAAAASHAGRFRGLKVLRGLTLAALCGLDGPGKRRLLEATARKGLLSPQLDLGRAHLRGGDLSELDLAALDLRNGNLCGASLERARLNGADLTGADLRSADLRGVDLAGAVLHRANLHRARLHEADLSRADLSSAVLEAANLWRADLSGADLTGARVAPDQLQKARSLAGATGPDGRPATTAGGDSEG